MPAFFKRFVSLGLLAAALVLPAGWAQAQALVLKDGTRIPAADFAVKDGKIIRTVHLRDDKTATSELQTAAVGELDWPYMQQLNDAKELLAQGRPADAVARLREGVAFLAPFKDIKGGSDLYRESMFELVLGLPQANELDECMRLLPQVEKLPLTEAMKMQLQVLKLDIERQTSSNYDALLGRASMILDESDDSAVGSAVWQIIGDIHQRQKNWEEALMAYLHIPVFYGTQVQRVPAAELESARMLVKMRRFADASLYYRRLVDTYPGSSVAEAAQKEMAAINGMKNEDQQPASEDQKTDAS